MLQIDEEKMEELTRDISSALNKNSVDTDLATPDFILAEHVVECLQAYGKTLTNRKAWFKNQLDVGFPLSVKIEGPGALVQAMDARGVINHDDDELETK